jgi:hypothetical protein
MGKVASEGEERRRRGIGAEEKMKKAGDQRRSKERSL